MIGVNTAIYSPSGGNAGVGFAVPSDLVSKIVADLQDDGQIDRGWLGVQIKPVSEDVASVLGLDEGQGTQVEKVIADTPADKAGLKADDIVLSFDGTEIKIARDLTRAVANTAPDTTSEIEILRKGERMTLAVTLANRATAQDA